MNHDLRSLRHQRSMKWFNWFLEKTAVGSDIDPLNHPPLCWLTEAPMIRTGELPSISLCSQCENQSPPLFYQAQATFILGLLF